MSTAVVTVAKRYVTDAQFNQIHILEPFDLPLTEDTDLVHIATLGGPEGNTITFDTLKDIAIDRSSRIYVADSGGNRIIVFEPDSTPVRPGTAVQFVKSFGSRGYGDGQFIGPTGIAVDDDGNIFVSDRETHRIQVFDAEFKFLTSWGEEGTGNSQLKSPNGVAVGSDGVVYVADTGNDRIQMFRFQPGQPPLYKGALDCLGKFEFNRCVGEGSFSRPWGVTLDAQGNLYVVDTGNNRIVVFQRGVTP